MYRVLYTDPTWAATPAGIDPSRADLERGEFGERVELRFGPFESGRFLSGGPELWKAAEHCDAMVVNRCEVDERLLDAAGPSLRVVVRAGVGVDNLNAPLLRERGILPVNVPDYCVDEVATHTLALALALERQLIVQHTALVDGSFDPFAGGLPRRPSRCTAGIVGFGRIGRAVARKLQVVYGSVIATDPYVGPDLLEGYGARPVSLAELLEQSDVVSLHCPLDPDTEGMIGEPELRRMRPGAYLINAARGRLVQPGPLLAALDAGRIGGAGLDVFSPENPYDDPDWAKVVRHERVVATSHRAFLSAEALRSARVRAVREILAVLDTGAPLFGAVPE